MNNGEDHRVHITLAQMVDYQEGRLNQEEVDLVEAHLGTSCRICQDELAWLRETQNIIRNNEWVQPPDFLRDLVRRIYRDHFQPQVRKSLLASWLESLFSPKLR